MAIRRRGVFGYNLPPQVGDAIIPADLGIVGVIGRSSRGITGGYIKINRNTEVPDVLGPHRIDLYTREQIEQTFKNARRRSIELYYVPYVATDAVQAAYTVNDTQGVPEPSFSIKAAYKGRADKSAYGNKIGFTLQTVSAFTTKAAANALLSATALVVDSVAGVRVGSRLRITSTGPVTHYAKVSAIDYNTNTLTISALTNAVADNDTVEVTCLKITTYLKDRRGIVNKYNTPFNDSLLSLESEDTERYINTAFSQHPYLVLNDLLSDGTIATSWPADITTVTFLAGGADGTAPSSAGDWTGLLPSLDSAPVRFIYNAESTAEAVNKGGESYCIGRLDSPIYLYNMPVGLTKTQMVEAAGLYQRSDQVQGLITFGWRNIPDSSTDGELPTKKISVVGSIAGAWVRAIYDFGIQRGAAGDDVPLDGFVSTPDLLEDSFTEEERTEIYERGGNLVQGITGRGVLNRSFITPSTNLGARYGHYLLMQNFFKVSAVESLYKKENTVNRLSKLQSYGDIISDFGLKCHRSGFPFGTDPNGCFGEFIKPDGSRSSFTDVFRVQVDEFNNTASQLALGEGSIFLYFFPPSLLDSLGIGVGVFIPL